MMAGQSGTLKRTVEAGKAGAPAPATPVADSLSAEERLSAWVTANARYLAVGAGVLAAVVLVTWFLAASARRKETFARQSLEQAWGAAEAGNVPQASAELQRIATSFAGTDAAIEAALTLNRTRLAAGQHQLAVDDLRRLLQSGPPARFVAPANMLLGAGLESLGQPAEAAEAYMAASTTAEMDHAKAEALLGAGRAYRAAGSADKARGAYQEIIRDYRETAAFPVAEIRLGEMGG